MKLRQKTSLVLSFFSLFCFSSAAFSEKVFIESTAVSGDSEYTKAFYELISQAVESYEDQELVTTEADANLVLSPKVISLGEAAIVTLNSRNKKNGDISSQKLKIRSIDELDIAAERLIDALFQEKSVQDNSAVGQITRDEQTILAKRKKSMGRWFLGFGPALAHNLGKDEASLMHWVFGYAWELDTALLKLEVEGHDGTNGNDTNMGGLGFGYTHLFSLANHSPIVTADILWGSARSHKMMASTSSTEMEDNEKDGFLLGLGAGYLFYRTSDVNLETSLVYTHFLGEINGKSPGSLATRVSLYF